MAVEGRTISALPTKAKHNAISHIHLDQTGVPIACSITISLLGTGAKSVTRIQSSDFAGTLYAIDVPFEDTNFLNTSTEE